MEVRAFIWTTRDGLDCCIDIHGHYNIRSGMVRINRAEIEGIETKLDDNECAKALSKIIEKIS